MGVNRDLAFWTNGVEKRPLLTADSYLYAIDAQTGLPISSFGKDGRVDLHEGLDQDVSGRFISSNTPGIIYQDKLILGAPVSEALGSIPGHIRAFNKYYRRPTLGSTFACCRFCHSSHLYNQWETICRYCLWRRETGQSIGRYLCGFCTTIN